jgi:integrase
MSVTIRSRTKQRSLRHFAERFIEATGAEHAKQIRNRVDMLCRFVGREVSIDDLSRELLERWLAHLADRGLSLDTLRNYRSRIALVWSWAFDEGLCREAPPLRWKRRVGPSYCSSTVEDFPEKMQILPAYRTVDGRAVVTVNGVVHDLGTIGSDDSRIAYDRVMAEFRASGFSKSYGVPIGDVTLGRMVTAYMDHARAYYGAGKRSEAANMDFATRHAVALYGKAKARDFGPLQLKAVRQMMIDSGLARKTINGRVQRIVRVFRWAAGEGLVGPDVPAVLATVPGLRRGRTEAREREPVQPVAPELVDATLQLLHPIVRAMVELQRLTGARPGEICILRPCDVDRSADVWLYRPSSHKCQFREKDRIIYIGLRGQAILRPYLLRPADSFCFSPMEVRSDRMKARRLARVTPERQGNVPGSHQKSDPKRLPGARYTAGSYAYAIRRVLDRHGLERWSPNQLRHLAATEIRRRYGLEAAQVMLGHSRADVTQIYAERDCGVALKIAKEVG